MKDQATVYVNRSLWDRWAEMLKRKEGKSASLRIRELIDSDLARLEGVEKVEVNPTDYATAERNYLRLLKQMERLRASLKKAKAYDELSALAKELGLDAHSCRNVDEVSPKVLENWEGKPELAYQFIMLLERNKEKRELEVVLRKK